MMFSVRPSGEAIRRYRASGEGRADTVVEDVFRWAGQTPDAPAVLAFGERDGRGGYRLVGRVSDRIGGAFMILVADVEDALRAQPDITDVAVVGWRDNLEGCAVLVSTVPVTLDDVRSYLSGLGMTEWYRPTRVERVEALPRNHMGKVERAQLRAWLAGEAGLPAAA